MVRNKVLLFGLVLVLLLGVVASVPINDVEFVDEVELVYLFGVLSSEDLVVAQEYFIGCELVVCPVGYELFEVCFACVDGDV